MPKLLKRWSVNVLCEGMSPISYFLEGQSIGRNLQAAWEDVSPEQHLLVAMAGCFAYSEAENPYLLNVPASRMSANPAIPSDFFDFARNSDANTGIDDFLPRSLYGEYLGDLHRWRGAAQFSWLPPLH